MKLGISSSLKHKTPQEWAQKHVALGLKCVNFPVDYTVGSDIYMSYKKAADENGLTIAEVGVWKNTLAKDPKERACGEGTLNLELFAELTNKENSNMPMIIEHLTTDEEYEKSVKYVQGRLKL